ncbi:MAG: hypothetical protein PWR26_1170 [Methanosarcinales archaeon]|nr:hypothetical protein [Methanosarcinales archaeon]
MTLTLGKGSELIKPYLLRRHREELELVHIPSRMPRVPYPSMGGRKSFKFH